MVLPKPYTIDELNTISDNFVLHLKQAIAQLPSSLAFLPHPLPKKTFVKIDQQYQLIKLGGTNTKSEIYNYGKEGIHYLLNYQEFKVPIFNGSVDLCNFLANIIHTDTQVVALNFAFPTKPILREGRLDGILFASTKEHVLDDMFGKAVGQTIESFILEKTSKKIKIAVANDTVCLLLGAIEEPNYTSHTAIVVGTGFNIALHEQSGVILNLEAGNFDAFTPSDTGSLVIEKSINKSAYHFEKEVSGKYLFQHFNLFIDQYSLPFQHLRDSDELSSLSQKSDDKGQIAKSLLKRSASLVASHMVGIYKYYQKPQTICITEGSFYWHGYQYHQYVQDALHLLGYTIDKIHIIKPTENHKTGHKHLIFSSNI
ncbi:MAG: hypothetical protein WCO06_05845 [Candidatus Roizmanbacteria bacterium]